ncbi:type III secretion system inner rod subunit SctI [Chromobacterium piscinae]|uniref:Type III secretion system inner rod subunit SctI n=1 Tax=Chromobacterium piscinae TaxID=686831 RepID=A0ABV0HD05_9NEIS
MNPLVVTHIQDIADTEQRIANEASVLSLDDRLLQMFSQSVADDALDYASIMKQVADIDVLSNPARMLALQKQSLERVEQISVASAFSHKATSAVETVLRA